MHGGRQNAFSITQILNVLFFFVNIGDGRIVVTAPPSIAGAEAFATTIEATTNTTPNSPTTATTLTPNTTPVDLPLSLVLGKMPQKHFHLTSPADVTINNTPGTV